MTKPLSLPLQRRRKISMRGTNNSVYNNSNNTIVTGRRRYSMT